MSKPKKITDYKESSINYCSGTLQELLNIITEKFNTLVPEEYRDNVIVGIEACGDYDDGHNALLVVRYDRMETPEEVLKRLKQEEASLKYKRDMFLRLKKELGEE